MANHSGKRNGPPGSPPNDNETAQGDIESAITAGAVAQQVQGRITTLAIPIDAAVGNPEDPTLKRAVVPIISTTVNGDLRVEVLTDALAYIEKLRAGPQRRIGTRALHELASLVEYTNRYKTPETVAYADVGDFKLRVVIDEHPAGAEQSSTRWRDFGAVYSSPRSPEWKAWTERCKAPFTQEQLAEWIDARMADLTNGEATENFPTPIALLDMSRDLVVRSKGTYERKFDDAGNNLLVCKTETDTGSTTIPRSFLVLLRVFDGGKAYRVEVRMVMGMVEGRARFTLSIHRQAEIERDAFGDVRAAFAEGTGVPVFAGKSGHNGGE